MGAGIHRWWRDINHGVRRKAEECRAFDAEQARIARRLPRMTSDDSIECRVKLHLPPFQWLGIID